MKKNTKIITVAVIILVCSLLSGVKKAVKKRKTQRNKILSQTNRKKIQKLKKQLKMRILEKVKLKMIMI